MKFHPAAQILTWCLLTATIQVLASVTLLVTAGSLLLFALVISWNKFIQLFLRTRWIILSLMLIYAYITPGQPLSDMLGMFSPSREGLTDGVQQLARLLAALAGLAILQKRMHRLQFVSGLHTLFTPLQCLGLSSERLAVRLELTLFYAEVAMLRDAYTWQDILRRLEPEDITNDLSGKACHPLQVATCHLRGMMELQMYRFAIADVLLLSGAMLIFILALR